MIQNGSNQIIKNAVPLPHLPCPINRNHDYSIFHKKEIFFKYVHRVYFRHTDGENRSKQNKKRNKFSWRKKIKELLTNFNL